MITFAASPNHSSRIGTAVSMIVIHATVGSYTSSLAWLRSATSGVSIHYLIDRDGSVTQLVADDRAAWHAGRAVWRGHRDVNERSIGIELVNLNTGRDPYPPAQLASARDLCGMLIARHAITRTNIVRHLDIAIPRGRKTDPAGFPWDSFVASLYAPAVDAPALPILPSAPLISAPRATAAQCVAYLSRHPTGGYTPADVRAIVAAYYDQCAGVDPLLAIAQLCHETGRLTSWWSQRPRRNPAGLGVTGMPGVGLVFATWAHDAIPAHLGRLLAYALPAGHGTPAQRRLIDRALTLRSLPPSYRGCAPTLLGLDGRWAVPGLGYSGKLAAIATAIRGMP